MGNAELNLGVSLFSFTNEWRLGQYTLESLLARLADSQIGPGGEVVGFPTLRGYPRIDATFVQEFRRLMDKYRRVPTCLSANTDTLRHRRRPMTDDEKIADLEAQIEVAAQLGFPVMRVQIGLSEAVLQAGATPA